MANDNDNAVYNKDKLFSEHEILPNTPNAVLLEAARIVTGYLIAKGAPPKTAIALVAWNEEGTIIGCCSSCNDTTSTMQALIDAAASLEAATANIQTETRN